MELAFVASNFLVRSQNRPQEKWGRGESSPFPSQLSYSIFCHRALQRNSQLRRVAWNWCLGKHWLSSFDQFCFEHFVLLSPFSGLPHQDKPSVVSIETKCHLGALHWAEPFGGLRVTFNPRDVHADYKLCFTARHPGVRIYQEHLRNLTLLTGANENVTRKAVCVKSTAGQRPVLYLETQENQTVTQLNYTVLVNGRKRPRHERRKGKRHEV